MVSFVIIFNFLWIVLMFFIEFKTSSFVKDMTSVYGLSFNFL